MGKFKVLLLTGSAVKGLSYPSSQLSFGRTIIIAILRVASWHIIFGLQMEQAHNIKLFADLL